MTKQEKLTHYERLLEVYQEHSMLTRSGMCYAIFKLFGKDVFCERSLSKLYPELYEQKPKLENGMGFWFEKGELAQEEEY